VYPQVFGKYVLEKELARGGMARVVLATLRGAGGFEKRLVVKQIRDELAHDSQFVRRFVEEAKTTVSLSHPNIVPVYELGVEQGTYFLAMELVEGLSIAELLRERNVDGTRRVLTPEEGAYVGIEVCRALDYAHRRMKVVHRDITPRNVMLDEEGQVKLIDFGIAAPALVAGHEILGSPGHMPPEQVGGGSLGPPTDIFALAVLLMEAWTGSAPFRRATPEECDAAMRAPHPKPSDFESKLAPLDDAIRRAMRVEPKERQQDAGELARELRAFLGSRGKDVDDVQRGIAERVRDAREALSSPDPPAREASIRPAAPSAGDLGTHTFAAREEHEWTSTGAPPADAASTRRLGGDEDREDGEGGEGGEGAIVRYPRRNAAGHPRGRKDDPAMMIPTPLMVEPAGEMASSGSPETPKRPPVRPAAGVGRTEPETIATRPLETPVDAREIAAPRESARTGKMSKVAVASMGAIALVAAVLSWMARSMIPGPGALPMGPASVAQAPTATAPSTAPGPPSSQAPAGAISIAPPATPLPPSSTQTQAREPSVALSAPSATAEKAGRATAVLVGDPGTRVSVDGASRGTCPVSVTLEPGQHEIRFMFDATGESRGERVGVKAGDRLNVRASFTGASPTIRIQRM
jgi:serine/threonine-protein kinase